PVDDPPVLVINAALTVPEGGSGTVASTILKATDVDSPASQIIYRLTATPTHGALRLGTATLVTGAQFTQAQIDSGQLNYLHDGSETTSDTLQFTINGISRSLPFGLHIWPVDDPPVLVTNTALTVLEGGSATVASTTLKAMDADSTT